MTHTGTGATMLSIFDDLDLAPNGKQSVVDWGALVDCAFLYTSSEKGNSSGIRFGASVEDAKRWCSSPVSRGQLHGVEWSYFWTSAANFIRNHRGDADAYGEQVTLDLTACADSGDWDQRIADAGVSKISLACFEKWLEPAGVKVIGSPPHLPGTCWCWPEREEVA